MTHEEKLEREREEKRERERVYRRQYYAANREKDLERQRRYRAANPEKERERRKRYYEANREAEAKRHRLYEYAHRKGRTKRQRVARANGYLDPRTRARLALKEALWQEQGGRCYLCREPLQLKGAHLDHDHRCHPSAHDACGDCVRGLSHGHCNIAVGYLCDDPDRIEQVARNLRTKLAEVEARLSNTVTTSKRNTGDE